MIVLIRLRTIATLAAALALGAGLAACGGDSADPQALVDDATLQGIESGVFDLEVDLKVAGDKGGRVSIAIAGPFQGEDPPELPRLGVTATAKGSLDGEEIDFDGGLTLLGEEAYVRYDGVEYEVDPTTFGFVRSTLLQQSGPGQSPDEVSACQEAVGQLEVGEFVDDPSEAGEVDVGGTSTTKLSGNLDAAGAVDALIELTDDPDCRQQLSSIRELPSRSELEEARKTVQDSVKRARVELYVGDDDIVRRLVVRATIEPPPGAGADGAKRVDLDLDMTLTGINEEQQISAPRRSRPIGQLFLKLGVNPIELIGILEGGEELGSGGLDGLLERLRGAGSGQ